jgi:chromosome segregation ATPase
VLRSHPGDRLAAADDLLAETRRKLSHSEEEALRLREDLDEQAVVAADAGRREAAMAARVAALNEHRQEAEAALRAARAERDVRQQEAEEARARVSAQEDGDAALRREIARLGRALLAGAEAPPSDAARADKIWPAPSAMIDNAN